MPESRTLDAALKILPIVGACITFIWGVWVWKDNADDERTAAKANAERYAESRRIEATKPFLEMQLRFYVEAADVAAQIAASRDERAIERFWELYYGDLALVEDNDVALAMVDFGNALKAGKQTELNTLAIELTRSMRRSVTKSWDTDAWQVSPK
jgi:hypothetical protein